VGPQRFSTRSRVTEAAQVTGICDLYEPFLKRAATTAPKAEAPTDWRRLVESPTSNAIVIATPTPDHRAIALAGLQAGKHVYCEAPIAASIEDAGRLPPRPLRATGVVFQAGLQGRSNPLYRHVLQFVKSGGWATWRSSTRRWGRKDSWRRAAPTPSAERALNWRWTRSSGA
jgi:predicted dehydrogenase